MERQDLLKSFQKRTRRRFIDPPQPFPKIQKHTPGIFITALPQRHPSPPMRFLPVLLGQMPLGVPILMNRTPLVDQLLPIPVFERFPNPFSTIGHPQNLLGKPKTSPLHIRKKLLTNLMILRRSLPKTQYVFVTFGINTQGHQEGFSPTMDGVDKNREGNDLRSRPLL